MLFRSAYIVLLAALFVSSCARIRHYNQPAPRTLAEKETFKHAKAHLTDGTVVTGKNAETDRFNKTLRLVAGGERRQFAFHDIDTLYVANADRRFEGAIVGFYGGIVLGILLSPEKFNKRDKYHGDSPIGDWSGFETALYIAAAIPVGIAAGVLIGKRFPVWNEYYFGRNDPALTLRPFIVPNGPAGLQVRFRIR